MKINWKKLWKEFDKWAEDGTYPDWYVSIGGKISQKVKIQQLVRKYLEDK